MPEKLDRCVKKVKKKLKDEYVEENGKQPSAEELEEMEDSAWAICQNSLGE